MQNIPYARQNITDADIDAVVKVLKSDFLTQGQEIAKFEQTISKKVDAKFSVAVSNATSALHIACLALGLKAGDWLWTSPISFLSSSNAGLFVNAKIKFIDINPISFNIDASKLAEELEKAASASSLPKIIVVVHLAGNSADMQKIKEIADKYEVKIIEDAAHALGGKYQNFAVGSCKFSDACVFSFHPVKIITSGEGGMVTTNDEKIAEKLRLLRSHGVTRENAAEDEAWTYEQLELGFNYRITDIQAALGTSQAQRLEEIIQKRNQIAQYYLQKLEKLSIKLPFVEKTTLSAWHLFIIQLKNQAERKFVFNFLRAKNIGVNVHYIPIPTQPYYKSLGYDLSQCPNAESYYQTCLSLPLFPELTQTQLDYIIENLKLALEEFKCL